MLEVLPATYQMPSGLHESMALENATTHDLRASQQIKQDIAKLKKMNSEIMKSGLIIPDRTGEQEIKREFEWFEEEMKYREALRTQENDRKEQSTAELADLRTKEQTLEQLKTAWQLKKDEITLQESELEQIQKEFEDKVQIQLREALEKEADSSEVVPSRDKRMKEEALRRSIRKSLKQGDEDAKISILLKVEEKIDLEKSIARLLKEIGLMKQKIRGRVRSHANNMQAKQKLRADADPLVIPSNEELYAPKVVPPRPVILSSYQRRLEEAKIEKAERRAKIIAQRKQAIKAKRLAAKKANTASSSSSSSTTPNITEN